MKKGRINGKMIWFILLCLLAAAGITGLFLLNLNRMTYRVSEQMTAGELEAIREGNTLILPLSSDLELLQTAELTMSSAQSYPDSVTLFNAQGEQIQSLRLVSEEGERKEYRVSDRYRPRQRVGGWLKIVLRDADGPLKGLRLSGGSRDPFWLRLTVFFALFVLLFLMRCFWLLRREMPWLKDRMIRAMLVMGAAFLSTLMYASPYHLENIDEYDNMIGGMVLWRQGKVIYRDYVTQHTPFAYWLGAFYAALGAGSSEGFRLLFQISCALVLGLLYDRHRRGGRGRAVALLAALWGPLGYFVIQGFAGSMLSDNIQALAMTALLLEMLAYFEDHRIGAGRCAVVSACVFITVGVAFLSVYALAAAAAVILTEDLLFHRTKRGEPMRTGILLRRYGLLIGITALPFLAAVVYFGANHALRDAYDLAFRFNVEVYPSYTGFGQDKLQPLRDAFDAVRTILVHLIQGAFSLRLEPYQVLELLLFLSVFAGVIRLIVRRRPVQGIGILCFLWLLAVRGTDGFHSAAFWEPVICFAFVSLPCLEGLPAMTEGGGAPAIFPAKASNASFPGGAAGLSAGVFAACAAACGGEGTGRISQNLAPGAGK